MEKPRSRSTRRIRRGHVRAALAGRENWYSGRHRSGGARRRRGALNDLALRWGPERRRVEALRICRCDGYCARYARGPPRSALIPCEDSPLIDRYAAKMKITEVHKGCNEGLPRCAAFQNGSASPLSRRSVLSATKSIRNLAAMELAGPEGGYRRTPSRRFLPRSMSPSRAGRRRRRRAGNDRIYSRVPIVRPWESIDVELSRRPIVDAGHNTDMPRLEIAAAGVVRI